MATTASQGAPGAAGMQEEGLHLPASRCWEGGPAAPRAGMWASHGQGTPQGRLGRGIRSDRKSKPGPGSALPTVTQFPQRTMGGETQLSSPRPLAVGAQGSW